MSEPAVLDPIAFDLDAEALMQQAHVRPGGEDEPVVLADAPEALLCFLGGALVLGAAVVPGEREAGAAGLGAAREGYHGWSLTHPMVVGKAGLDCPRALA